MTGYAHHPYTRGGSRPPTLGRQPGRDHDQRRLAADEAARPGGQGQADPGQAADRVHRARLADQPPDLIFGVTDAQQAEYINQSDWIAYKNPRVHTVAQYKIVDDRTSAPASRWGCGCSTARPKPAYAAYRLPIWVSGKGANVTVYGQVRPADNGTAQTVDIQVAAVRRRGVQDRADGAGDLGQRHLHRQGAQLRRIWRLSWNGITSRQAEVSPK